MKIAGIQKNSFVDYPGKVCAVLFTPGCNMNCFYCHNREIISSDKYENDFDIDEVFQLLSDRRGFLDAVVLSGGEPTLQKGLEDFIKRLKGIGYMVKIDTNGTNPHIIESLIQKHLVDYVAMDIKAPFEKYQRICHTNVDIESIKKSINILMEDRVDYEFRTTVAPGLCVEDLYSIAYEIRNAKLYSLQNCRTEYIDIRFKNKVKNTSEKYISELSPESILSAAEGIRNIVKRVVIRGILMYA